MSPSPGSIQLHSLVLQKGAAAQQPQDSPKIPAQPPARLPSNIPLRTLSQPSTRLQDSQEASSSSLLHPRHSYQFDEEDEAFSSEASWTDTGDIAEQLDDEDPIRDRLTGDPDDEILGSVLKRQPRYADKKRVRYDDGLSPSRSRSPYRPGAVSKEAIEIPEPAPRRIPWAERKIAAVMAGGTGIHGLTGKPLIYFTSIFVSLGVFLFGYDQGVMSGIIPGPYFIDYFHQPSRAEVGTMVAILEIGAFISSLTVGRIGDILGRRKTILYGSMIFFVGGALQTFATSMAMMMVGRIIAGLGVGMLSTIVPVYQSEISPPHNRGKLACIEFSGNIIGYTTSVWVDYFCGYIEGDLSWRLPLMMQCIMGALLGFGALIIVESPR